MIASEEQGRAEALRRIAACRETRVDELELGGLQLTVLDGELLEALCQLGWLRRLFLGASAEAREEQYTAYLSKEDKSKVCNTIGALPSALFDALTRLAQLDLSRNGLNCLPASIANLTALTSLDLSDNRIGDKGAQTLRASQPSLALQLLYLKASESMGNHDSRVVDADSVD
jgi:Leucine-rich repeat (LRR) protein